MIKANELRVGNWFYIGELIGQCNADSFKDTSLFEPIPLTPEILEKCWFKPLEEQCNEWYVKDKLLIKIYDDGTMWLNLFGEEMIIVNSLHQLQNIHHALTGEELNYTP